MFQVCQVFINPRDDTPFTTVFGEFETLAEAKQAVRVNGLKRWVITQTKVVAQSQE